MKRYPSKKRLVLLVVIAFVAGCAGGYLAAEPDPLEDGQPEPTRPTGPPRLVRDAGRG